MTLQQGQVMVFSLLFLGAILLGLVFLYKAGRLTSEKMQLQNAADATAYSVSVIESRDLNFAAYINRAMIANEVAIGQLVGLSSWADHLQSFAPFLRIYANAFNVVPVVGNAISAALNAVATGFNVVGNIAKKIADTLAKVGIAIMYNLNKAYSLSTIVFHTATITLVVGTVYEMIKQNAPNGKLSDFGFMALIGHIYTYHRTFLTVNDEPKFFAGVVREGRDPFSEKRGWSFTLLDVGFSESFKALGMTLFGISMHVKISLDRLGGTELRFVKEPNREKFGWSSADTTGLNLDAGGSITVLIGSGSLNIGQGRFKVKACVNLLVTTVCPIDASVPFPTSAPFGAGVAQAGKTGTSAQDTLSMGTDGGIPEGPVDIDDYGGSPLNNTAWYWPGLGVTTKINTNNVYNKYAGLPKYLDNSTDDPSWGFEAPYVLVGVVTDIDDLNKNIVETSGSLKLENQSADEELAVIAKSEVYFSRPNDLSYFKRSDGLTETANTFNPFWQARMVDTTPTERMIALAVQQKQAWIGKISIPGLGTIIDFNKFINNLI